MANRNEFTNPIIAGFAPDPSVVLADGMFFLVNSSFHVFPGLPIYASRDLKTWAQIGNAINRPSQNILLQDTNSIGFPIGSEKVLVATVGLSAPTIRWHRGTFYVICTNNSHTIDGKGLNMRNFYGIDPSLFFDDDGRAYIQGSWREGVLAETVCTIRQFEVKIDTGKRLSETVEIWKGFAGNVDAEGPHIYKKDGYYFLITAEAGTFEHHMIGVARSTNIWGPYEPYENNPILTAFGKETLIQNTGLGELFKDGHGFWWCVCLGVRNNGGRYPLGRETFLAPVTWPKDGWPAIKNPTASFHRKQEAVPSASESVFPSLKVGPRVDFVYIRDPNFEDYHFSNHNRKITLTPRNPTLSTQTGTTSFVGKRLLSLNSAAKVTLNIDEEARGKSIHAGLSLYKDDIRHADIYYNFSKSNVCFSKELKLKGELVIIQKALVSPSAVTFRVGAEPQQYKFEY